MAASAVARSDCIKLSSCRAAAGADGSARGDSRGAAGRGAGGRFARATVAVDSDAARVSGLVAGTGTVGARDPRQGATHHRAAAIPTTPRPHHSRGPMPARAAAGGGLDLARAVRAV